jgi:flagellar basal body-associated protein FliL
MAEKKKEEQAEPAKDAEKKKKEPGSSNKMIFLGLIGGVIAINGIVAMLMVNNTIAKLSAPKVTEEKAKVEKGHAKKSNTPEAESSEGEGESGEKAKKSHAGSEEEEGGAIIEKPVTVIVNVAGTDGTRFLRMEVVFGYNEEKYKLLAEEFEKLFAPKVKDLLIDMLSQIPLEELQKPDTKNEIRRDLKRLVNEMIPEKEGQVTEVFINDFIIQ